ncbi:NADPH-dependent FMN reductase [Actinokineospora iranica]|uniref:NAD(P)H-dependent FMN reductase n=1 Tax=Actinokineospora iranica TaxID=1271860 RepID=A0A1G6YEZ5_9PSEU|nr:NAD(P)H-dependent oxidoreductase [Actinokineospora iranica]SDD88841.1 NAD(P)H-dependent FMN reductase [Actinokineospora iranica]
MPTLTPPTAPAEPIAPVRLAVILGSVRENRFGPTIAAWFLDQAKQRPDLQVTLIDLAEPTDFPTKIAESDAFAVITPEYNHGYPGPLKTAIDSVYTAWHAKPVAFITYGGISGGLRAAEQLRQVFAELHTVTIRETVSFANAHTLFTPTGAPKAPDAVNPAATLLLDQLTWWAHPLRQARTTTPYPTTT